MTRTFDEIVQDIKHRQYYEGRNGSAICEAVHEILEGFSDTEDARCYLPFPDSVFFTGWGYEVGHEALQRALELNRQVKAIPDNEALHRQQWLAFADGMQRVYKTIGARNL